MSYGVLYRAYDKNGGLLYVGRTTDPYARYAQHASRKPWWNEDVVTITEEEFGDAWNLETAERNAIREEYPFYNVVGARPGCITCGSPSPSFTPVSPHVHGSITVLCGQDEPFVTCMDPFHFDDPADKAQAKRICSNLDYLREMEAIA